MKTVISGRNRITADNADVEVGVIALKDGKLVGIVVKEMDKYYLQYTNILGEQSSPFSNLDLLISSFERYTFKQVE